MQVRMATMAPSETLILGRADVRRLLDMPACIDAVEQAFLQHARGETIRPGILGAHARDGVFHVKTAGMQSATPGSHAVFAAKVNANFPDNPDRHGLPTIQGVIALFNAHTGQLLALFDSIEITKSAHRRGHSGCRKASRARRVHFGNGVRVW